MESTEQILDENFYNEFSDLQNKLKEECGVVEIIFAKMGERTNLCLLILNDGREILGKSYSPNVEITYSHLGEKLALQDAANNLDILDKKKEPDDSIIFSIVNSVGARLLAMKNNGIIFVKDKEIQNETEVVEAFKLFLTEKGLYHA